MAADFWLFDIGVCVVLCCLVLSCVSIGVCIQQWRERTDGRKIMRRAGVFSPGLGSMRARDGQRVLGLYFWFFGGTVLVLVQYEYLYVEDGF